VKKGPASREIFRSDTEAKKKEDIFASGGRRETEHYPAGRTALVKGEKTKIEKGR